MQEAKLLNYEMYKVSDDADWVVFVHGAGGSIQTWLKQVVAFRKHYNVLVLDLRDHGNSKEVQVYRKIRYTFDLVADDVIRLIEHLQLKSVHLVGVSVGSVIIRRIEQKRPDLVKSLIFSGGMFRVNFKIAFLLRSGLLLSNVLPYQYVYRLFANLLMPRSNHKVARKIFIRESIKIKQHEFMKWMVLCKDIGRVLKEYFFKPIQVPCLVIMGDQDHVFLSPAVKYYKKHRNIDLRILPKCGHVCSIEQPHTFNELSIQFLAQHFSQNTYNHAQISQLKEEVERFKFV